LNSNEHLFDKEDSDWDEDENEQEYILDVFVKKLNIAKIIKAARSRSF
jgi:hypothetical protein